MQCDLCPNEAVYHLTEVVDGKGVTRHLCQSCGEGNVPVMNTQSIFFCGSLLDRAPNKGALPAIHTHPYASVTKSYPQLACCSRCNARTTVILKSHEELVAGEPGWNFRFSALPLCSACADAIGIKYPAPPVDQVCMIHHA